ncbi:SurA N-terminal domain-containing protein [Alkalibacillus aidingensis]|uniref:hypothetical protein n=1 Tax=Alkalibacillus aidingensis TaxID=2747607 RepID=UPI0016610C9A|nr:hypothetical protein [Alkalibacillus aidingensis]
MKKLSIFTLLVLLSACGSDLDYETDDVIAQVYGEDITVEDVLISHYFGEEDSLEEALDRHITGELLLHEAKEMGFDYSQDEVDQQLEHFQDSGMVEHMMQEDAEFWEHQSERLGMEIEEILYQRQEINHIVSEHALYYIEETFQEEDTTSLEFQDRLSNHIQNLKEVHADDIEVYL